MKFRIGQKVVCVDEPRGLIRPPWVAHPKQNQVYTIRAYRDDPVPSVLLHEIRSMIGWDGAEAGFWEERFRPVVTTKTDISCFTALLDTTKKKKPEVVA